MGGKVACVCPVWRKAVQNTAIRFLLNQTKDSNLKYIYMKIQTCIKQSLSMYTNEFGKVNLVELGRLSVILQNETKVHLAEKVN